MRPAILSAGRRAPSRAPASRSTRRADTATQPLSPRPRRGAPTGAASRHTGAELWSFPHGPHVDVPVDVEDRHPTAGLDPTRTEVVADEMLEAPLEPRRGAMHHEAVGQHERRLARPLHPPLAQRRPGLPEDRHRLIRWLLG